ncbi:hypothetical protein M407DRAFT_31001 [Tulasnella calospora MUT 4182]|uniref:Uncharacterized protein n=1 Tax=Tulasnella calospora MUT 4182 TaxID=1051891 RepID=A0A0C3Q7A2_9AGAM|nr:hypothetical protein M407DRAFT_31001 [Tulasnella calospora MUT 4182]
MPAYRKIKFGPKTLEANEEKRVTILLEPKKHYPTTSQVFSPVRYLTKQGKPYDFQKRRNKATQHTLIDITNCPRDTLAHLINLFPLCDISFSGTNLLIPYVPAQETLDKAYQVLPIDTIAEFIKL